MSLIKTETGAIEDATLPGRAVVGDLDWVIRAAARHGHDVAENARALPAAEWSIDLNRADEMRAAQGLDEAAVLRLIERFRERNRAVWGPYSDTT
jgi:hypothetical protein